MPFKTCLPQKFDSTSYQCVTGGQPDEDHKISLGISVLTKLGDSGSYSTERDSCIEDAGLRNAEHSSKWNDQSVSVMELLTTHK